jgi:zona occludens toxin (predicted ATPase)
MITLYSGTPGSGKSLHSAQIIYHRLRAGKAVICTFDVNLKVIKGKLKSIGHFTYADYNDLTIDFLKKYAQRYHKHGVEGQTLVIIDEAQLMFNPREFGRKDRLPWITFLTMHRHFGFDFIFISQFDRLLDRQIRYLIEYDYKHLKANNHPFLSLLPIKFFVCKKYWYSINEFLGSNAFLYNKKYASIYDSYLMQEP